jgi:hypothetical protein
MPALPESYVEVPIPQWVKARYLLLRQEADAALTNFDDGTVRVIFTKEQDARVFTQLFREETGSLLAVHKVTSTEDLC